MKVLETLQSTFETVKDTVEVHSPEILVVAGVVGVVGTVVAACVATTRLDEVLEDSKQDLDDIHKAEEAGEVNDKPYTKKDASKDKIATYSRTALKLAKLYAAPVIVGTLSIAAILSSNHILQKRNIELAASYTALNTTYQTYQSRVIEKYGEEAHKEILFGTKSRKATIETVDEETGEIKKSKETIQVVEGEFGSPYAFAFTKQTSSYCQNNEEYDGYFLKAQQSAANDMLNLGGKKSWVSLNDVADLVGVDRRDEWQVVGWRRSTSTGDGYIDFRIHYVYQDAEDGRLEKICVLDPNVDGLIFNLPKKN